ncbi:MAG: MBOAT family protein [Candidatus Scalindua sp.]|nr:MBOAT family protein [Candidatus Scalindua sp.]
MFFNSIEFGIFLLVVLASYYLLPHRYQNLFLLFASYTFYSFWDIRFLSLIIISTLVDFTCGIWIDRSKRVGNLRTMKLCLVLSLTTNLGILCFFKYFNFFIENTQLFLASIGLPTSTNVLKIILPVGISFYTFQTLSYTIDIYRGKIKPIKNVVDFALFVSFFPQLVAGPIERAANLIPQIQNCRIVTQTHRERGLYLILIGLVHKVVIADSAGILVDMCFASPEQYTSLQLGIGLILYSVQIYGDFSGYSKIARGSAMLLGFDIMRNFKHPYFSQNVAEFWQRWHISLSSWLRDYLYIPLGGNRKGQIRTHTNLFITMLLGGLWHGASWNFVFWGLLHGLYLSVYRIFQEITNKFRSHETLSSDIRNEEDKSKLSGFILKATNGRSLNQFITLIFKIIGTFLLISFTWLFFRASDFATTTAYLRGLSEFTISGEIFLIPLFFILIILLFIDIPQAVTRDEYIFLKLPKLYQGTFAAVAITLLFLCGNVREPFVYFQF